MDTGIPGAADAERAARQAGAYAGRGIELLARLGFAGKGAVYVLVGVLAASAAFAGGGATPGSGGALASIAGSTWGRLALALIALGLAGYVVWRAYSALANPENDEAGTRAFYAVTAFIYAALAVEAARLALTGAGGGDASGDGGAAHWSAELLSQPFGQILLGIAALAVLLYGLHQIWNAWKVDLDDRLDLSPMTQDARRWTIRFGRFGLAARGLVLAIIGGFLLVAAVQSDPSEARGLGGALGTMNDTPWLLGIVALGLIAYGAYQFVRAKYRRIRA